MLSNKSEEDRSTTDTSLDDNQSQPLSKESEKSDGKEESSNEETDGVVSGDEFNNDDTLDNIVAGDISNARNYDVMTKEEDIEVLGKLTKTFDGKVHPSVLWILNTCFASKDGVIHWSIPHVNHNDAK